MDTSVTNCLNCCFGKEDNVCRYNTPTVFWDDELKEAFSCFPPVSGNMVCFKWECVSSAD